MQATTESNSDGTYCVGGLNAQGQPHGRGIVRSGSKKEYYVGDLENGFRSGKGIENDPSFCYEGGWLNDQFHGRGVILYHQNDNENDASEQKDCVYLSKFEGEWRFGKMYRGFGVYMDGSTFEGEFKDEKPYRGIKRFADGCSEEGEWVNGGLQGYGIVCYPTSFDSDYYKGEFKDHKKHGKGELRWKDGEKVVGEWVNGEKHGEATIYYADGSVWTGRFVNNKREGPGRGVGVKYGYSFEGNYHNDERSYGDIRWLNGDLWTGHYFPEEDRSDEDKVLSEGMMTFAATGDTLKGRWLDLHMKDGAGDMTMWIKAKNKEVKGEWIDGQFRECCLNKQ